MQMKEEYRQRGGRLSVHLTECDTRQEGMKKKRGTNVYSESSEYQTVMTPSVGKSLQESHVLPAHSQTMEMLVSYAFLFLLSSNACEAKDEVIFIQIWEVSGWARNKLSHLLT